MSKTHPAHKVVFKNDDKDLFVFVEDVELYKKWKKDSSIPLVQVVDSFQIYDSDTGSHTGLASKASKQTISTITNTTNEDDAIKFILQNGELIGTGTQGVEKNMQF